MRHTWAHTHTHTRTRTHAHAHTCASACAIAWESMQASIHGTTRGDCVPARSWPLPHHLHNPRQATTEARGSERRAMVATMLTRMRALRMGDGEEPTAAMRAFDARRAARMRVLGQGPMALGRGRGNNNNNGDVGGGNTVGNAYHHHQQQQQQQQPQQPQQPTPQPRLPLQQLPLPPPPR